MSLYDIAPEYDAILEVIASAEESGLDVDEAVLAAFEGIQDSVENKTRNIVRFHRSLIASAENAKAESDRLAALAKVKMNRAKNLKSYLSWVVDKFFEGKFVDDLYPLRMQKNGQRSVIYEDSIDLDLIDPMYVKREPKLNTTAISKALKDGKELPFARLADQTSSLRGL